MGIPNSALTSVVELDACVRQNYSLVKPMIRKIH
jgi:hypothetical protein